MDEVTAELVSRLLSRRRFSTIRSRTAADAVALLWSRTSAFSLVFTESRLADGAHAGRLVVHAARAKDPPIPVIAASESPSAREHAAKGVVPLLKPFGAPEFEAALGAALLVIV